MQTTTQNMKLCHSNNEPTPDGCVPLHELCEECKDFFDNWKFLDAYDGWQAPADVEVMGYNPSPPDIKIVFFRNTAQLLQPHETCHFCTMISSIITKYIKTVITALDESLDEFKDLDISFRVSGYFTEYVSVMVLSGGEWCYKNLRISKYGREAFSSSDIVQCSEFGTGAFGPMTRHYVPRRANDSIQRIGPWVQACDAEHSSCNSWQTKLRLQNNKKPARILELSPEGVRLRCIVEAIEDFNYLTLSHIWGTDPAQQLRLISSRLDEFQLKIPLERTPEIFKEAFRITRSIGFNYLWIDSLCIIQDSASDWESQASRMSTVYSTAFCNIAFLFPPEDGFISTREDPRELSPCILRRSRKSSNFRIEPEPENSNWFGIWPWLRRAWTFQEYLLSPRTIFYGDTTIMWECQHVFADELLGIRSPKSWSSIAKNSLASSSITKSLPLGSFQPAYMIAWQGLINDYRNRALTFSSDRIMAFAGVAEAFAHAHDSTYLAGSWAECLPQCLLWYAPPSSGLDHGQLNVESAAITVPSWSWFNISIEVTQEIDFAKTESDFKEQIFCSDLAQYQWADLPVDVPSQIRYHNFTNLRIMLNVATYPTTLRRDMGNGTDWSSTTHHYWRNSKWGTTDVYCPQFFEKLLAFSGETPVIEMQYTLDDHVNKFDSADVSLALLQESRGIYHPFSWWQLRRAYYLAGLILQPSDIEDAWKRIGFWRARVALPANGKLGVNVEHPAEEDDGEESRASEQEGLSENERWIDEEGSASLFIRMGGAKFETITLV